MILQNRGEWWERVTKIGLDNQLYFIDILFPPTSKLDGLPNFISLSVCVSRFFCLRLAFSACISLAKGQIFMCWKSGQMHCVKISWKLFNLKNCPAGLGLVTAILVSIWVHLSYANHIKCFVVLGFQVTQVRSGVCPRLAAYSQVAWPTLQISPIMWSWPFSNHIQDRSQLWTFGRYSVSIVRLQQRRYFSSSGHT